MAGPHLTWLELLIRLGSALLLGALIGAERQWRQRTAGLRTYSLVSIGAALFVLLAALTGVEMGLSVAGVPHRAGGVDVAMKQLEQRPQGNSSPLLKVVG